MSTEAQPANVRLAAAAQATAQTSFRLKVTIDVPGYRSVWEGAYDPVGPKGFVRHTHESRGVYEERIIGDDFYSGSTEPGRPTEWMLQEGRRGFMIGIGAGTMPASVDPAEVLNALTEAGVVKDLGRSGTGPDAVNTYSYSYQTQGKDPLTL